MSRLIDADELREKMYHEAFEKDSDMQKWDSGCWIRYKMFENAIDDAPTIEPQQWIPISSNPITTGLYLVLCNEWGKNRYRICAYYSEVGKWIENGKNIAKFITHWMPLPEPWKGGAADGT